MIEKITYHITEKQLYDYLDSSGDGIDLLFKLIAVKYFRERSHE